MEQQCGQVNWAPFNPLPADGAVQLWTAQAWAHGVDVVSYFRWRAATMAQEVMHSGLLRHDETPDRGHAEVARTWIWSSFRSARSRPKWSCCTTTRACGSTTPRNTALP